uniref:Reverse transcriptase domain-containing protein n=1 Tax=Anolis carolinensis TaxID=28377 RepID=A0A803T211_ANOCA
MCTDDEIIIAFEKFYKKLYKKDEINLEGCPLSPLIFIFTLEILLRSIRKEENLKGIRIEKQELKVRAFADDVICILENPKERIKDCKDFPS